MMLNKQPSGILTVICLSVVALVPRSAEAQIRAELLVGGGAAMQGSPADIYVPYNTQYTFYVQFSDTSSGPLPFLNVYALGPALDYEPGHQHNPALQGTISPSSGTTDGGGVLGPLTFTSQHVAARVFGQFATDLGDVTSANAFEVAAYPDDLEWTGQGNFILVGSTPAHLENHFATSYFYGNLVTLANNYGFTWGRNLAYNDASLIWGGVFDLNQNFAAPHVNHNYGSDQDVRANGGPSSVPCSGANWEEIREWFVNQVIAIFGGAPLLEADSPSCNGTGDVPIAVEI